ncbi:MAG: DUF1294 domain-containing protein [Lysobacteraceae bacterium]|nr:MAG: DUF1294 domain-containing protein [Xanthomonadaceae bacterium]
MARQLMIALTAYVLIVNVLAYSAMVLDKAKAARGLRRISERTLLTLAAIGGSAGTVLAQQMVRHKTRKEPFRSQLIRIIVLQIVVLSFLGVTLVITGWPAAFWNSLAL